MQVFPGWGLTPRGPEKKHGKFFQQKKRDREEPKILPPKQGNDKIKDK